MNKFHFKPIFTWNQLLHPSLTTSYGVVNESNSSRLTDGETSFCCGSAYNFDKTLKPLRVNTNVCCSLVSAVKCFLLRFSYFDWLHYNNFMVRCTCVQNVAVSWLADLIHPKASLRLKGRVMTHISCWKESEKRRTRKCDFDLVD